MDPLKRMFHRHPGIYLVALIIASGHILGILFDAIFDQNPIGGLLFELGAGFLGIIVGVFLMVIAVNLANKIIAKLVNWSVPLSTNLECAEPANTKP